MACLGYDSEICGEFLVAAVMVMDWRKVGYGKGGFCWKSVELVVLSVELFLTKFVPVS